MTQLVHLNPDNIHDIFTNLILNLPHSKVREIAKGMKDGHVEVTITVAGVEISTDDIVQVFENLAKDLDEHYRRTYDVTNLDKLIHEESEAKLRDEVQPLRDKLEDLTRQLDEIGDLLTPYWEKKT